MSELDLRPDFMNRLVFDAPGAPDLPVPPVLRPGEQIVVHRTLDLSPEVDARLSAAAARQQMSVEEYVVARLTNNAA